MEVVGSGATNSSGAIVQTPDGGVEVDFVAKGIGEGRSFCDRRGDRRLEKVHCRCRVLPACRRGLVRRLVGGHACDKSRLRCGAHQRFCWPGTGVVGLYRKLKAVIENLADQAKPDLAGGEGCILVLPRPGETLPSLTSFHLPHARRPSSCPTLCLHLSPQQHETGNPWPPKPALQSTVISTLSLSRRPLRHPALHDEERGFSGVSAAGLLTREVKGDVNAQPQPWEGRSTLATIQSPTFVGAVSYLISYTLSFLPLA